MRISAKGMCLPRVLGRRQSVWAVLLVSGLLTGTALGQIDVNETGLHDANEVFGIDGSSYTVPWTNDQIISLLAWGETDPNLYTDVSFSAYGIYSATDLINSGAIGVSAFGGTVGTSASPASAFVQAYGILTFAGVNNNGDIAVAATGGNASSSFDMADGHALAYGIFAEATVSNSGDIAAAATGGNANAGGGLAYAHAEAYGIYGIGDVDNTGGLTVIATGGNAAGAGNFADAHAGAYGIYGSSGLVSNAGDITITATGGTANAGAVVANAQAYGIITYGDVINSGNITATASTQDGSIAEAVGIYRGGEGDGTVTNTGIIRAFGDSAYELFVSFGTTTLVNTYNVTLDGDPQRPSIFVDNGGMLALNDATLTVTDVPGDTLWNTEYRLFGVAGEGIVQGNFGSVEAVNPDVTALYSTYETATAADDTVALAYAPEAAETFASASVEKRVVAQAPYAINRHMTMNLMYDMLSPDEEPDADSTDEAGAGQTACQRAGGAFLAPHYSYMEKDNDPLGYDAGLTGVSGGYTQCVNDSLLGLHLGYGQANIDYTGAGYSANTEDVGIVTSGFSGMTRWQPWLMRYGFSGFHGWHDYSGLTGLGLAEQETASYNSYGGTGLVMVGRTFRRKAHIFLPEIGANWLWLRREGYTTEATDAAWNTTYSTLDDHDVWGEAALHWQSLYKYKKIQITPSASLGVHQLLTDGETEAWQSIPGAAPVLVEDRQDRTALALASAVVLRSRRTALTLAYDGEYSSDIEQHNFWMKFKLRF